MGIITNIDKRTINEILISIQPANLQYLVGKQLHAAERDIKRAELIREKLNRF